jgi:hypothetical protein
MALQQLSSAAADLAAMLDNEQELRAILVKWAEKKLKARTTKLDQLKLLVRTCGEAQFRLLLTSVSEPVLRGLVKNIDVGNTEAISKMRGSEVLEHVLALACGIKSPLPKQRPTRTRAPRAPRPSEQGNILERAKLKAA